MTTYKVLILDKSFVQIDGLIPATTYTFRVHALGPEGNPGSYSADHEFNTFPLGTSSLKIYSSQNSFSNISLYMCIF